MLKISRQQMLAKAEQNGWKPFTEKEWKQGIRPEKDLYYTTGIYGFTGLVFLANDDDVYYVDGRTSFLFKVMQW